MPKVCERCQQISKLSTFTAEGRQPEDLCKKCYERAEISSILHPPEQLLEPASLQGSVKGVAGGIEGVCVQVQGVGISCMTDKSGAFFLKSAVCDLLSDAVSELFKLLKEHSPTTNCEPWLLEAMQAGDLPAMYEPLLRKSDIGATVDNDTFVKLLVRSGVADRVAARVFNSLRRKSSLILTMTKPGFAPCVVPVSVADHAFTPAAVEVRMQQVGACMKINPADGGQVMDQTTGASVTLAPGTRLVNADGSAYQGEVTVSCSVVDVSTREGIEAMPGDYSGCDSAGKPVQIESFGAMWVGLDGDIGEKLGLADGSQGMELGFFSNVPVNFERLQVPPSVWKFDEVSGKWNQHGDGCIQIDGVVMPQPGMDPSNVIVTKTPQVEAQKKGFKKKGKKGKGDEIHALDHEKFTDEAQTWTKEDYEKFLGEPVKREVKLTNIRREGYWNCDRAYFTCFVAGSIADEAGEPVTKANVFSVGRNYSGASPRSALKEKGEFTILAQCQSEIDVIVLIPGDSSGSAPLRFQFGPFQTNPPGDQGHVGILRLSEASLCRKP